MVFGIPVLYLLLAWILVAIVLTVIVWRVTRSLDEWPRVLLRCLMLVVGFGFAGVGTDAAAIPLPLLLILIPPPPQWQQVLTTFLVFWVLFVGAYFGIRAMRSWFKSGKLKVKSKSSAGIP